MKEACVKIFKFLNFKGILNKNNIIKCVVFMLCLPFVFYIEQINYILGHSIIEILNTAVCFSLVIIVINSYVMSKNNYFFFLGIVFGFVSFFNFLHCAAYAGSLYNLKQALNMSDQLNIAFRLVEGLSIVTSFVFLNKPVNKYKIFGFYIGLSFVLMYIIFYTNYFPTCFTVGLGHTGFYIRCEYVVISCMLISGILFIKNKKYFNKTTLFYMSMYLMLSMIVRYLFIIDKSIYHDINIWNHILKFISYYFLYKALVENIIKNPLNSLFNDLNNKNIELESKTIELEKTIAKLNEEKSKTEKINEELEASKNNYKELLEFLPVAVVVKQTDRIIYVNTAAVKLFRGKDKEELIGESGLNLIHKDYLNELDAKREEENYSIECKLLTLYGEIMDVELRRNLFRKKDDNSYLIAINDISERKKAEKTEKLLNEARENEKLKTEFFANLSHELRTPISVIYSAIQVIELNTNKEHGQKYNAIIKQNCYRLLRLINNIIDSTKIDAGFLTLNFTYRNIVSVVEDIALSVANYIELQGMSLIFDTDVEEKYLNIDVDAIERIILNLISNAIKFRHNRGIININIFDKENGVIICVKDNGIGIPTEQQRYIFERFKQVDKSFTRNKEGSGIGLSLVKSLVEFHKGTITLKSEENVGSEFIIELPVAETSEYCVTNEEFSNSSVIENINIEFSDIYF